MNQEIILLEASELQTTSVEKLMEQLHKLIYPNLEKKLKINLQVNEIATNNLTGYGNEISAFFVLK